jgi:hypothetical protein
MWTVVQQGNLHELEALVDHAAALGFSNQVFSLELTDFGLTRWQEINAAASAARSAASACGFGTRRRSIPPTRRKRCPLPFERAYISSDQRVVPCCFIGNPDVAEIGTAPEMPASFASI